MIEVSANIGQLQPNISFGYGFTAIIVAFLARLNPAAVIISGLLIALIEVGGDLCPNCFSHSKGSYCIQGNTIIFSTCRGNVNKI